MPERELVERHLVRREPPELRHVVGRLGRPLLESRDVIDVERRDEPPPVLVAIHPDAQEPLVSDLDRSLLT